MHVASLLQPQRSTITKVLASLSIFLACFSGAVFGQVEVTPLKPWTNYFSGQKITLQYQVRTAQPTNEVISWTVGYEDQVIARRSRQLATKVGEPSELNLNLDLSQLPSATPRKVTVAIAVGGDHAHTQTIWLFPSDPFEDQRERLRQLDIHLFDPNGRTTKQFEQWSIPCRAIPGRSGLTRVDSGLLILGAGFSFRGQRNFEDVIATLVSQGVDVLSLEPIDGEIPIPGTNGSTWPEPSQMAFHQRDVIHHFDKRLDTVSWPPDGQMVTASLLLSPTRTSMVGKVLDRDAGWPWLDVRFANGEGRFLFCGFDIIEHAESTPAAGELLKAILLSFEETDVE